MHVFKIWAPLAKAVAVQIDGKSILMDGPDDDGCWTAAVDSASYGTDYGFVIDADNTTYPDPRSQRQPNGVHALSRLYNQNEFRWTDPAFQARPLASAVIYELHIGTFTSEGTLDAAAAKLEYLQNSRHHPC